MFFKTTLQWANSVLAVEFLFVGTNENYSADTPRVLKIWLSKVRGYWFPPAFIAPL